MAGAIAPHAPLLTEGLRSEETSAAGAAVQEALQGIGEDGFELCIVVSPHGVVSCVYEETRGSLRSFGVPGPERSWNNDLGAAKEIAETWGRPLVSAPVDHGVLVPLLLWDPDQSLPVIGVALEEPVDRSRASWEKVLVDADGLAGALREIASDKKTLVVASCNTSLGLSRRAPMTEVPATRATEEALLGSFDRPLGELATSDVLSDLWTQGSCAAGPLAVMCSLWPDARPPVLTYQAPVGVGYLVASIDG